MYHVMLIKCTDLINARKFTFWDFFIMYLNVVSDDLYQKIAQKFKL